MWLNIYTVLRRQSGDAVQQYTPISARLLLQTLVLTGGKRSDSSIDVWGYLKADTA